MGRAVSDGEYQAAICAALPVSNIILFAVPGKEAFYTQLGFKPMQTAMAKLEARLADPTAGYLKKPWKSRKEHPAPAGMSKRVHNRKRK